MEIYVQTSRAKATLEKNLAAHQEEYKKQLAGWQEKMKEYSEQIASWAVNGGDHKDKPDQPAKPVKFDKEYKRLLHMLEIHTQADIKLEDHEYDQIFRDKFSWKSRFMTNSATYAGGSLQGSNDDADEDDF